MTEDGGDVLIEAIGEAKRGVRLLAKVVEAASTIPRDVRELDRIAREMQELAFQTWLLATEARAEASRLAQLSEARSSSGAPR